MYADINKYWVAFARDLLKGFACTATIVLMAALGVVKI